MSEFRVGEIAKAKIGRNLVEVEILECGNGTFRVKSLSTGREFNTVRIEKINNMEENIMPENIINTEVETETTTIAEEAPNPAPECAVAKPEKKKSLLDIAAQLLSESDAPLSCKELVAKAKESGWIGNGKTPEQTLYSGIFREIKEKGENARFKKSDLKGKFEFAG